MQSLQSRAQLTTCCWQASTLLLHTGEDDPHLHVKTAGDQTCFLSLYWSSQHNRERDSWSRIHGVHRWNVKGSLTFYGWWSTWCCCHGSSCPLESRCLWTDSNHTNRKEKVCRNTTVCLFIWLLLDTNPKFCSVIFTSWRGWAEVRRNHRVKQTKPNYPALSEISAFAENRRKI